VLTLLVQLQHRVEYLRKVPSRVFLPKPEVDSALVRISERDPRELPACEYKAFQKLVRRGFSQRRKQLGKLIREELPDWEDAAVELGLNTRARAEELSLEQWIALTNRIAPIHAEVINDAPEEQFPVVDEEDRLNPSEIEAGRFFPPTIIDGWMTARPRDFAPGLVECWKIGREINP